jgi:hypothetical protein
MNRDNSLIRLIADSSELNSCGNRKRKYWLLSTFDEVKPQGKRITCCDCALRDEPGREGTLRHNAYS